MTNKTSINTLLVCSIPLIFWACSFSTKDPDPIDSSGGTHVGGEAGTHTGGAEILAGSDSGGGGTSSAGATGGGQAGEAGFGGDMAGAPSAGAGGADGGAGGAGGSGGTGEAGAPPTCLSQIKYRFVSHQLYMDKSTFNCTGDSCVYDPALQLTGHCANTSDSDTDLDCTYMIRTIKGYATLDTKSGLFTINMAYTWLAENYLDSRVCDADSAISDPPKVTTLTALVEPVPAGSCPTYTLTQNKEVVAEQVPTLEGSLVDIPLQISSCTAVIPPWVRWSFTFEAVSAE